MPQINQMARTLIGTSLLAIAAAGSAHAAALEQTVPAAIRLLYQEGRYIEFGVAWVDPDQSGDDATIPEGVFGPVPIPLFGNTGDVFEDDWSVSAAYKADLNDKFSYVLLFDQPLHADTDYGAGSFSNPALGLFDVQLYEGSKAELNTYQITAALAYDVNPNVKVFGGLRAQRLDAEAAVSFVSDYSVTADEKWGYGWMLGAAYERPEKAIRVALTYQSKISYDLDTDETIVVGGDAVFSESTETDVDTPQSVQLDFQTGVAPKTLVFGYIRWVDWSEFSVAPPLYEEVTADLLGQGRPLIQYGDDWWTYNLGIGRQLTDVLAGSLAITWEPGVGGEMTSLGPYDGRTTGTAALTYEVNGFNVTGGVTYGVLGDTHNLLETDYNDGSIWGLGLRVGYTF